ncbi:MAG: ABC transporter permease, partial [Rikenellaceae bacterium]
MLRISLRYLRSKSSHSVVNLISRVALFAIATPVAAVIILLSVFNGFGKIVEDMASSIDAPITVQSRNGRLFEVERVDTAAIRSIRGVEALSLGLEQSVLLRRAGRERVITMRGVEPSYAQISNIAENITLGAEHTQWGDYDRLLVGGSVAHELGVNSIKGSRVEVYSIRRNAITSILPTSSYRHKEIDITGLFSLDVESESKYAITSLRFTQELFQAPGSATQLFVAIDKDTSLAEVKSLIEEVVGEEFSVKDRYQMNPTLYSIIKGEKRAIILIAIFVMILASFTLIGALVMQILDKRGEFTPLLAMGAS